MYTTTCVPGTYRGNRKVLDKMGLEVQAVVSLHLGAGS